MPHEFVYRKKAAFTPPFRRWLARKDFKLYMRDVLCSQDAIVTRIESRRAIGHACDRSKPLSIEAWYFLWAALFTIIWITAHWRKTKPRDAA